MDHALRAVLCIEPPAGPDRKPLLLEPVLFCPLLAWMRGRLAETGVRQFFVVSPSAYEAEVNACFLDGDQVTVSDDPEALRAFLTGGGLTAVFPRGALPLAGGAASAFTADTAALSGAEDPLRADPALLDFAPVDGWTEVCSLAELQQLELTCRDRIAAAHLENGVRILDPSAVYIDPRVVIGRGTVILPGTILRGRTVIGENCTIGPNAMVRDCIVGDETEINASQTNESRIGSRTHVGPFAYVRPNSNIGNDIKVGDFVEIKNSTIGDGTKISHLTYVGDSDVGRKVNFGCGTVTTNYDGFKKYRCTIGDDAFLGCNTNLIAPVTVGDGAYTAAGSTITSEVPADALAVARARQRNLDGWAARRRAMHGKK